MQSGGAARIKTQADTQRILHELQVHQIELELQNEELQKSKAEVDAGLEKYADLYEYAPVGYFSLTADGTIQMVNLTGASMLGVERSRLVGRRFGLLVCSGHRPIFNSLLHQVFAGETKRSGEFELLRQGERPQTVRIEAQRLPNGLECRAVISDISERKQAEETQRRLTIATASNEKLKREIGKRRAVEAALSKSEMHARQLLEESNKLQGQLRDMSHRILKAQEEQRKQISRELHDEITQILVGINVQLTAFTKVATTNPKSIARAVVPMRRLVEDAVSAVHQFAQNLRPAMLDELGLIPSLISYLRTFSKPKDLKIHFSSFAKEVALDNDTRTVLYRVAQEALINVAKHAGATNVEVVVLKVPGGVCLEIADNGKSFDVSHVSKAKWSNRLGLVGMRERVEMVGGTLSVVSASGAGTIVRAVVPLAGKNLRE
jgi:PAS domain S-box-containing protein